MLLDFFYFKSYEKKVVSSFVIYFCWVYGVDAWREEICLISLVRSFLCGFLPVSQSSLHDDRLLDFLLHPKTVELPLFSLWSTVCVDAISAFQRIGGVYFFGINVFVYTISAASDLTPPHPNRCLLLLFLL